MHPRINLQPFYPILVIYERLRIAFWELNGHTFRSWEHLQIYNDNREQNDFYNLITRIGTPYAIEAADPSWIADGSTPLHIAVRLGHTHIVRGLLEAGADVQVSDSKSYTPLHVAAFQGEEYVEILAALVEAGAPLEKKNDRGRTALHEAADAGCVRSVSILLAAGADPNVRDNRSWPPLEVAARGVPFHADRELKQLYHTVLEELLAWGASLFMGRVIWHDWKSSYVVSYAIERLAIELMQPPRAPTIPPLKYLAASAVSA